MKIVIGCDHVAIELKEAVIKHLESKGHILEDVGTNDNKRTHYPIYAKKVARIVVDKQAALGILICGTGIGMSIAANKVKGIRAAACSEEYSAKLTKLHNNANIICFGSRVVTKVEAYAIVDAFLSAEYEGGRHQIRVDMMHKIENSNDC